MGAVELAPAGTVATVEGRSGVAVFVIEDRGRFRVLAGSPEDPARQLSINGIERQALAAFAEALSTHMATRTGKRPAVPYDEAFPASARLSVSGDAVLNVYDDGDDFSIMVVAEGTKAGTGTRERDQRLRLRRCAGSGSMGRRDGPGAAGNGRRERRATQRLVLGAHRYRTRRHRRATRTDITAVEQQERHGISDATA